MGGYVFYDLETTDLNFCGQILNYAFVEVDFEFNEISNCTGMIKMSRTQLPNPYAILGTKIDPFDHQAVAKVSEPDAMAHIRSYWDKIIEKNGFIKLIGFNSSRFDLPYIRTSMIRNGISPYSGKAILYGDVLHVAQKLAVSSKDFLDKIGYNGTDRPSLRLEKLCHSFGILTGKQLHESYFDTNITIRLAEIFAKEYGINVLQYSAYEPSNSVNLTYRRFPSWDMEYHIDPESEYEDCVPMVKIDQNGNYSLWANMEKFKSLPFNPTEEELKSCVSWYNTATSTFFVDEDREIEDLIAPAVGVIDAMKDIKLPNFFPDKNCDVEAFIYMLGFEQTDVLRTAIWDNDYTLLKAKGSSRAKELIKRFKLANVKNLGPTIITALEEYALYRYGGKMKVNKYDTESEYEPGIYNASFHPTLKEYIDIIDEKIKDPSSSTDTIALMSSLLNYYEQSDIFSIIGTELMQIERKKIDER